MSEAKKNVKMTVFKTDRHEELSQELLTRSSEKVPSPAIIWAVLKKTSLCRILA